MNRKELREILEVYFRVSSTDPEVLKRMPVPLIIGGTGIGKTSIIKDLAVFHGKVLFDLEVFLLTPQDIQGFLVPDVSSGTAKFLKLNLLPMEKNSVLFLDEINMATGEVQKALFKLILERKINDYQLPPDCLIICAGNTYDANFLIEDFPPALKDRFLVLQYEPTADEIVEVLVSLNVNPDIVAFLKVYPEKTYSISESFTLTPRKWEKIGLLLNIGVKVDFLKDTLDPTTFSLFASFLKNKIDILKWIENPFTPTTIEQAYMIACALIQLTLKEKLDMSKTTELIDYLPEEIKFYTLRSIFQAKPHLLLSLPSTSKEKIKDFLKEIKEIKEKENG